MRHTMVTAMVVLGAFAMGCAGPRSVVRGKGFAVAIDEATGSITVKGRGKAAIVATGEQGLWQIRFADGTTLSAGAFGRESKERAFAWEPTAKGAVLRYRSAEADVTVTLSRRDDGIDLVGEVTPKQKVVLDFALPARIRFDPARLDRFICPDNGNRSVGTAFTGAFFQRQPATSPSGWRRVHGGPKGYIRLYGGPLDQRGDDEAQVPLKVTPLGREWLGEAVATRLSRAKALVNRPPTRQQAEPLLVDSASGPYFSGNRLGGKGAIWRIGGRVDEAEKPIARALVGAVVTRLAVSNAGTRQRVGLVALTNGPSAGGWTAVTVNEWREQLEGALRFPPCPVELEELTRVEAMMDALASKRFIAILNPYGEWIPAPEEGGIAAAVDAVGRYVKAGGHWLEVGGYPFYAALRPIRYFRHGGSYPANFADFVQLDTRDGSASVYGVQPQVHEPWAGATRREAIFVPGSLHCGGDDRGGWCDRAFGTHVKPGETWRSPVTRIAVGRSPEHGLRAYCEANAIRRRLGDKMPPELLERFKRSVLVKYDGPCRDKLAHLHRLPVPSQVHFSDYLKGGFDKEYPDHLPPHPHFGTAAEMKELFDRCKALGHLVMPYTNPTWWCDEPKGPTFQEHGDAPLLRKLDGTLSHERYASNVGFTICHWHPAVQAANRETVRQFTEQYPVDILFQDQCGARGWRYDLNPASPTPYAYADGLVSMVAEDCQRVPLSTESGWDRVVNSESQLCGLSWSIVPTEGGPSWRRLMKTEVPTHLWTIYPLAQHIAHDKTAMLYHDLGQFVTNREVLAWTLGLGFCMSYRVGAAALERDATHEWLRWLDRIQKSVVARYVGEPVAAFEHGRGPTPTVDDDGVLRATYGPVKVVASLGPRPRTEAGHALPPYGFVATAPGVVAASLAKLGGVDFGDEGVSFVTEGRGAKLDVWVYAAPEQDTAVLLPQALSAPVTMAFDGAGQALAKAKDGILRFRTPPRPGRKRIEPPVALAGKAPKDWPGGPPAIGIIDIPGMKPVWTDVSPGQWVEAFEQSRLARQLGVPVRRIASAKALAEALAAGPTKWLVVVNPYGENFPAVAAGEWRTMLEAVRRYVEGGGCWWETGGFSFYLAVGPDGQRHVSSSGMAVLGVPVGGGEVDQAAEPLHVPAEGRAWLGDALSRQVATMTSAVNRGAVRGSHDPGHVTLVAGRRQDFIAGYRLDGWGWLWRIGGMRPNPKVALPVAVAAAEHLYTHPPLPVKPGGVKCLWHATVTTR